MLDSFYSFMDKIFGPLLPYPASLILIFSIAITLVITLIYLKVVDQEKVLRIREELDKLRKELNSLRKEGIKDKKKNVMKMQKKIRNDEGELQTYTDLYSPAILVLLLAKTQLFSELDINGRRHLSRGNGQSSV